MLRIDVSLISPCKFDHNLTFQLSLEVVEVRIWRRLRSARLGLLLRTF